MLDDFKLPCPEFKTILPFSSPLLSLAPSDQSSNTPWAVESNVTSPVGETGETEGEQAVEVELDAVPVSHDGRLAGEMCLQNELNMSIVVYGKGQNV